MLRVSLLLGLVYLISESRNGGNGSSEIEGKAARAGGERAGTRMSFKGIAEIEGKATRVGASECGQRASFNPDSKKSNQESRNAGKEIVDGRLLKVERLTAEENRFFRPAVCKVCHARY